jgi:hypothetical protein
MVQPVRKRDNREGRGGAEIGEGGEKRQCDDDLDGDKEDKRWWILKVKSIEGKEEKEERRNAENVRLGCMRKKRKGSHNNNKETDVLVVSPVWAKMRCLHWMDGCICICIRFAYLTLSGLKIGGDGQAWKLLFELTKAYSW